MDKSNEHTHQEEILNGTSVLGEDATYFDYLCGITADDIKPKVKVEPVKKPKGLFNRFFGFLMD